VYSQVDYVLEPVNIALGKPAYQSTTHNLLTAEKGVDGSFTTPAHSVATDEPKWWKVDLQEITPVARIIVWNTQSGKYNLQPIRVHVFFFKYFKSNPESW